MDFPSLLAVSNASDNVSILDPASPVAESIRQLLIFVLAVVIAICLVVEAVLIYSLIRFGRRGLQRSEPPQVYGSLPIEIAWTAAPGLIVFLLTLVIIRTEYEIQGRPKREPEPGDNALFVTVIGHQWWWEYVYDSYNGQPLERTGFNGEKHKLITANELHIPVGTEGVERPVYLTLKSADVCHSYWVPRLAGKTDLIPGKTNRMWFSTTEPGLYLGQCAEYCGTQHANMLLRVVADSPEDFQKWLDREQQPAVDDPAVRTGRDAFLSQSCINCHRVAGTRAAGTYGPDLTHLMSRETLAAGMLKNNRADLRRWVDDPQKVKPGCLMAAFQLSDRELDLIVDYLLTLK